MAGTCIDLSGTFAVGEIGPSIPLNLPLADWNQAQVDGVWEVAFGAGSYTGTQGAPFTVADSSLPMIEYSTNGGVSWNTFSQVWSWTYEFPGQVIEQALPGIPASSLWRVNNNFVFGFTAPPIEARTLTMVTLCFSNIPWTTTYLVDFGSFTLTAATLSAVQSIAISDDDWQAMLNSTPYGAGGTLALWINQGNRYSNSDVNPPEIQMSQNAGASWTNWRSASTLLGSGTEGAYTKLSNFSINNGFSNDFAQNMSFRMLGSSLETKIITNYKFYFAVTNYALRDTCASSPIENANITNAGNLPSLASLDVSAVPAISMKVTLNNRLVSGAANNVTFAVHQQIAGIVVQTDSYVVNGGSGGGTGNGTQQTIAVLPLTDLIVVEATGSNVVGVTNCIAIIDVSCGTPAKARKRSGRSFAQLVGA